MNKDKFGKILFLASEYGIYLLVIFLFMDKGESFRTIGIYIPPILVLVRSFLFKEKNIFNFKNSIFILMTALCLSGIISSILSPDPFYSLKWFKRTYIKMFLVFIAMVYIFQSPPMLNKISRLFVIVTLLFVIFTFYDFYTKIYLHNQDYGTVIRKYIVPLEVFLPFVMFYIVTHKNSTQFDVAKRLLGFIILVSGFLSVIFTGSRGGWISVSLGLLVWVFGYSFITKKYNIILFVFGAMVSIFIFLIIFSPTHVKFKYQQLLHGDTSLRKEIVWPAAIQSYLNLPLINKIGGNGLGRMIYLEDFKKWYIEKFNKLPEELYSPHNLYISLLYKQGVLGISIFILLIYFSFKILIKSLNIAQPLEMKIFALSLISVLVTLLIHGVVEDTSFIQWMITIPLIGAYTTYIENLKK